MLPPVMIKRHKWCLHVQLLFLSVLNSQVALQRSQQVARSNDHKAVDDIFFFTFFLFLKAMLHFVFQAVGCVMQLVRVCRQPIPEETGSSGSGKGLLRSHLRCAQFKSHTVQQTTCLMCFLYVV